MGGLSTEGLKADLVKRLQARLDEEEFGMVEIGIGSGDADTHTEEPSTAEGTSPSLKPVEELLSPNEENKEEKSEEMNEEKKEEIAVKAVEPVDTDGKDESGKEEKVSFLD